MLETRVALTFQLPSIRPGTTITGGYLRRHDVVVDPKRSNKLLRIDGNGVFRGNVCHRNA